MSDVEVIRRGPGRPPKNPVTPRQELNLSNRAVESVQFVEAPQFLSMVRSGLHSDRDQCDLVLIGPGVYVRAKGREYIVPFANIKHIALTLTATDDGPSAA